MCHCQGMRADCLGMLGEEVCVRGRLWSTAYCLRSEDWHFRYFTLTEAHPAIQLQY